MDRGEGLVLSHRRLAKAAFSGIHDITAQSVLANIRALERAVELGGSTAELERGHLEEVHRILFEGTRDEARSGRFRTEQNWIGGSASSPRNAEFVPPQPDLVWRARPTATSPARHFAADVASLQERWMEEAGNPRRGSGPRQPIELLPSQPIVNVKTAGDLLGGSAERSRQAIARLERAGVVRQTSVGKRNRAWESVGLFDLLDRFERAVEHPEQRAWVPATTGAATICRYSASPRSASCRAALISSISNGGYIPARAPRGQGSALSAPASCTSTEAPISSSAASAAGTMMAVVPSGRFSMTLAMCQGYPVTAAIRSGCWSSRSAQALIRR